MRHIPTPPDDESKSVIKQCSKTGWAEYKERWVEAEENYKRSHGDPWSLTPAQFSKEEQEKLYALYDTRRRGGPIERIRWQETGYSTCAVCGSAGGRSLDHALPRSVYPEFSITRENLVPACTICNSDQKGTTYKGNQYGQRLIHPYYDSWASDALWQVEFGSDLSAPEFRAVPKPGLDARLVAIVEYHLAQVLGRQWRDSSSRYLASLPLTLRNRIGKELTVAQTEAELHTRLADEVAEKGHNAWQPALLRGALWDRRVPTHLTSRARLLPDSV